MRSRDGDYSFTLRLCTVVLCFSLALSASDYLISYRCSVQNAALYNEHLDIAKSMKECQGTPDQTLILPSSHNHNLQSIIFKHANRFREYLQKLPFEIRSSQTTTNAHINAVTILTLKTQCFKVDFNDTFVTISHLKQPEN